MKTDAHSLPASHPAVWLCTWFFVGRLPKASGTAGSLAALPFACVIQYYVGNLALLIASGVIFIIGWIASAYYMRFSDAKDPKEIVIDEVAGMWLLLSFLYASPASYLFGFLVFRLFDIVKPWPISVADRKIGGGFGVMFDDILAALYPLLLYQIFIYSAQVLGHPVDVAALTHILQ